MKFLLLILINCSFPFLSLSLSPLSGFNYRSSCQNENDWIHIHSFLSYSSNRHIFLSPRLSFFSSFSLFLTFVSRLNQDESGGAWCPQPQIDSELTGSEWIQVNLTKRFVVTGIATQGRFGSGAGVEFLEEYWVEYSRDFGSTWIKWRNKKGAHLFHGNINTFDVKRNTFDVPIIGANMVRIVPFSKYLRTVCLRFELYGCPFEGM